MEELEHDPAMEQARQQLQAERRSVEEVVKERGVPQFIYMEYIKNELDNERNCMELPLTILILTSFAVLAIQLLRQDQILAVKESLAMDIQENANFAWAHAFGHKGIQDVNSIADFWSWARLGYLPLVVQPAWYYSEPYPEALGLPATAGSNYSTDALPHKWQFEGYSEAVPVKNDYLRYNRIIGGVRMTQEIADRSSPSLCRFPTGLDRDRLEAWLGKPCAPSELGRLTPEKIDTESYDHFSRTQWLLPEVDDLDELARILVDMEDGCNHAASTGPDLSSCRCTWCREQQARQPWLDERARRVEVAFVVYNPQYGMYSYVGSNFFFNRAGHIHKVINVLSAWAAPLSERLVEAVPGYTAATLWSLSLLYVCVTETKEVVSVVRGNKGGRKWWKAIREDYLNPWNIIDWVSICVGILVALLFVRMRAAVAVVNTRFVNDMIHASISLTGDRVRYQAVTESFFSAVETMCMRERDFRLSLYVYPNIIMLRLFKSFAAQPRLAIVTATLQSAALDLMHFGIVFVAVFLCMMVNSVLFFGQDLENFSTVIRALQQCFLAMFGDWDWDALKEIGYFKAGSWFWIFMVINVLILLNMLLAIIMEAYTGEKLKAGSAETLWTQTWQMRRRRLEYKRKQRVRLNDIWDVFLEDANGDEKAMLQSRRLITAEFLINRVPRMQSKQANRLLMKSLEHRRKAENANITSEDVKEDIRDKLGRVERRTDVIIEDVRKVAQTIQRCDIVEAHGDAEYDLHFGSEGRPAAKSQESIEHTITSLSSEIGDLFTENMARLEGWQESFEHQQDELAEVVEEMGRMVRQQEQCMASLTEVVNELVNLQGGSHDH